MKIDNRKIFKNFTIGFIPILIFLIADYYYGPLIGIGVAISFAIAELLYFLLREKRFEKFIIFDISLLTVFGLVSIALQNEFFFKLKPAVFELVMVVILGVHGFSNKPLLLIMGKRYFPDMKIQPAQQEILKRLCKLLAMIFLLHSLLIVWSALFRSKELWAFISGGLFYILFGLIIVAQFVYVKYFSSQKPSVSNKNEEWFDIVDEHGRIKGKAPRSLVHGNPDLIHPTVHLHVFNKKGHLFLQKRVKTKDLYPGFWDTAVGGHINSGEHVSRALLREAMEELGINAGKASPLFKYLMRNKWESELIHTYKITYEGPFKLSEQEIEEGRFWTAFEINRNLGVGIFTPNFEQEFKMLQKIGLI